MTVRGASRVSYAELSERLTAEAISSAGVATRLGDELFAVVGLLDTEHGLRRALSDPAKPAAEKAEVTSALLRGKVTRRAEDLVVAAAESRWATPGDMVDAIERLAVRATGPAPGPARSPDDPAGGRVRVGPAGARPPDPP